MRIFSRLVQSIKTDIGKPFDKSIFIDNSNSNVIDFIDQSIEIDTHNHRCSFKVLNLSILSFSLRTVYCWQMQNTASSETAFKKQAVFLPMRLIRGLHLFYLGVLRPSRSLISRNCTSTVLQSYNVLTVFNFNSFQVKFLPRRSCYVLFLRRIMWSIILIILSICSIFDL